MVDSLKLYEILKSADIPEPQARAIAHVIGTAFEETDFQSGKDLAQKVDSAKFAEEMHRVDTSMLRIESSLKQEILGVRNLISDTKFEMVRWMFIFWIAQVGATIGIIKVLVK